MGGFEATGGGTGWGRREGGREASRESEGHPPFLVSALRKEGGGPGTILTSTACGQKAFKVCLRDPYKPTSQWWGTPPPVTLIPARGRWGTLGAGPQLGETRLPEPHRTPVLSPRTPWQTGLWAQEQGGGGPAGERSPVPDFDIYIERRIYISCM